MFDDDEDEPAFKKYQEQAEAVADPFRRSPHNLIEEIEKLRFTYVVDDDEDAEEINEELTARPETYFQMALVSYLDGVDAPSESLLKLWREETRRKDSPFPLWRRYFRTENAQLKRLALLGLDDIRRPMTFSRIFMSCIHSCRIRKNYCCATRWHAIWKTIPRDSVSWLKSLMSVQLPSVTTHCMLCESVMPSMA